MPRCFATSVIVFKDVGLTRNAVRESNQPGDERGGEGLDGSEEHGDVAVGH